MGPNIVIHETGGSEVAIHTSCSVPIGPGQSWGHYMVMAGTSRNAGNLCRIAPESPEPPEPPEPPICPIEPVANYVEDVPCWAQDAVDWVIEKQLFNIYDENDMRDAVKFYRLHQLLQE